LNGELTEEGHYRIVRADDENDGLLAQLEAGRIEPASLSRLIGAAQASPELVDLLATSSQGQLLAEGVEVRHRRSQLEALARSSRTRPVPSTSCTLSSSRWVGSSVDGT
jgi:hypothetical protein